MKKHILAENYERFFGKLTEETKDLSSLPDNIFGIRDNMTLRDWEGLLDKLWDLGYAEDKDFFITNTGGIEIKNKKMLNDPKVIKVLDLYEPESDMSGASDSDFR